MAQAISRYLRMIKFSHSIFALPLAGIAFVQALPHTELLGESGPTRDFFLLLAKIIVCMVSLRSAAMGFNRLVDRRIDAANPRTQMRELVTGEISARSAGWFIVLSLAVFIGTAFLINPLCAFLSPIAILLVLGYSYTKRFTYLCHFVLGLAIGLAPVGTWIALLERVDLLPILWSAGLAFYIAGFDILYACQDADFDREQGLHSLPARFGVGPALGVARVVHVIALACFVGAGLEAESSHLYYFALGFVSILFFVEHRLVRPNKLDQIPIAFFHVNALISSVLLIGVLADAFFGPSAYLLSVAPYVCG